MKRFCIRLRIDFYHQYGPMLGELYDRVKLLAKHYNMSTNKMIIRLIEIGYIKMMGDDSYEGKIKHK